MEMDNSSSRSPDSSCPDYYSYAANLENSPRDRSSSSIDIDICSSNSVSSSTFEPCFENHMHERNNGRTAPIPENTPRRPGYHSNGRGVINFASVGGNNVDNRFRPIVENSSTGQSFHNSSTSGLNFPPVTSHWNGSASSVNNSGGSSSSVNYQNSSTASGADIHNIYKTTSDRVHFNQNPSSYTKPGMSFASASSMLSGGSKATAATVSFSTIEHSQVTSSVSSNSNYLPVPPSNTNYVNEARLQKNTILSAPIIPKETVLSSCSLNAQQSQKSAKNSSEDKGLKRKSPPLNCLDYLFSAPSSSREQNISINNKKNKVLGSSSYLELDDTDDEIQILTPETSRSLPSNSNLSVQGHSSSASSGTSTSWSTTNYHTPSVISGGSSLSSLNTAKQTISERDQSSRQTIQEGSSAIHNPLSDEELEQMLNSVFSHLEEIASSTNDISAASSTPETIIIPHVSDGDDSSSSSILSIHEVQRNDSSYFSTSKPSSPVMEKVPSIDPSLITIDDSPKNSELQELKTNQEAENVKEDFKKLLEDELICNICTELLIKPITLGCSHTFCKFCIAEWKKKKNQCPMCRAGIVTETPCLFLDNFISKAVEQLDPASVEKRLEIIKSREEEQKNQVNKVVVQPPLSSNLPQRPYQTLNHFQAYMTYQTYPNLVPRPSNILQQHPSLENVLQQNLLQRATILQRRSNMLQQPSNMLQQPSNVLQHSSSIPQQSSSIPQRSSSIPHRSSSIPHQSSGIPHQSSGIPHRSSSIPHRSSSIPHRSSNIPQQSPNIPQQPSNLLHQPSNPHHVPMHGFFFFK